MKKNKKIIAPSILSADFSRLGEEVRAVEEAGADWIHVDVMDGHFVPNLTIGPVAVDAVKRSTDLPCDVHLMIDNPDQFIKDFVDAGAEIVTVHQEAPKHLHRTTSLIKDLGAKAGVSINPATPVEMLADILPHVDLVLVMTVNPGFGGQSLIDSCISKIRKLDQLRKASGFQYLIEADGGISESTANAISIAGCDVFVAGSAIFKARNYKTAVDKIRAKIG